MKDWQNKMKALFNRMTRQVTILARRKPSRLPIADG